MARRLEKKTALAIVGIALLAALPSLFQIRTFDTFFHLAAGRQILDTGTIPTVDTFSYTFKGKELHNHSPLFQVIIAAIEGGAGFAGLSLFQWLLTAILMALASLSAIRSGAPPRLACIFGILPPLVFHGTIVPRPHVFGFLFLQIALALILSAKRQGKPRRLYALPLVFLVWLLSHGSNITLLAVMTVCLLGALWPRRRPFLIAYGLGLLLSAALVLLIKPSALTLAGAHLDSSFLTAEVPEWSSFSLHLLFGTGRGIAFMLLWLLSLAGVAVQSGLVRLERHDLAPEERLSPHLGVLLVGIMALALTSFRMAPLFLIGAAPLWIPPAGFISAAIIEGAAGRLKGVERVITRSWIRNLATLIFVAAAVAICIGTDDDHVFGAGLEHNRFPEEAVTVLDRSPFGRRVYNAYNWGGYLMVAREAPSEGVFVDGRAITLYSPAFLEAFTAAYSDPVLFETLARTYRCDSVLMPIGSQRTAPLLAYLERSPRWIRFHRDAVSVIYVPASFPRLRRR